MHATLFISVLFPVFKLLSLIVGRRLYALTMSTCLSVCLSKTSTSNLLSTEGAAASHGATFLLEAGAYRFDPSEGYTCFVTIGPTDLCGATENARAENAIRAKMQGWKMQE